MDNGFNALHGAVLLSARLLQGENDADANDYAGLVEQAVRIIKYLRCAMFPHHFNDGARGSVSDVRYLNLLNGYDELVSAIARIGGNRADAQSKALELINRLPQIKSVIDTDITAAYEGDPAAKSEDEVILTYPAFIAISIYRMAHELYALGVPILPRMMTEHAHRLTGVDIHPGATIGRYFFIDHGTGVVIGETTTIGDRVKLYQSVTLGAKSFEVAPDGTLVKGIKRHPDIGNNVVIYAGATILGGNTVIGDNCVIGGNVWLTHSVASGETVLATSSEQ